MALFYSSTNGLASGNSRVDALCHALCEVIERDATSLAMAKSEVKPAVASLLADIGFDSGRLPTEAEEAPLISLRGLPRRATALVRKLRARRARGGTAQPDLRRRHRDHRLHHHRPARPARRHERSCGCGTHPDARIALTRALTEAAQSRLTCIQGGRENLPDYAPPKGAPSGESKAAQPPYHRFRRHRIVSACIRQRRRRVHDRADAAIRF